MNETRRAPSGQLIEQWKKLRSVWFNVKPVSGNEGPRGQQIEATTTHQAECRWFAGASPHMRLVRGGRVYQVESVVDRDGAGRWLDWQLNEVRS